MAYTRTNWENDPSTATPINAARLNNIESGVAAAHAHLDGRLSEGQLSATFAATRALDGSQIDVAKGDTSYINWRATGSGAGYGIHLTSGPDFAGSGLIGLGVDYGTAPGLLVNNKAGGAGINLHNMASVYGSGVGFNGLQSNTSRELVRWQQEQGETRAPLAHLIATSTDDDAHLFEFARGGTDTLTSWFDNRGRFHVRDIAGNNHKTTVDQDGFRVLRNAGAPGSDQRWGSRITQSGNLVQFLATGTAADESALTYDRKWLEYRMDFNQLGFFGVTPVSRQALGAAAVTEDLTAVTALVNQLRTALINFGLGFAGAY